MKYPILTTLIGSSLAVAPAFAENTESTPAVAQASVDQTSVVNEVAAQVKAKPENAGEIVKNAIIKSKADSVTVAQIVKAAILASPNQIHSIYNNAMAVAPDAGNSVKMMIAAMLKGDQVAAARSANVQKALDFIREAAANEPAGFNPDTNTVWLESFGQWLDVNNGADGEMPVTEFGLAVAAFAQTIQGGQIPIPPALTQLIN